MSVTTNKNKAQLSAIWLPTGFKINLNTWHWLNLTVIFVLVKQGRLQLRKNTHWYWKLHIYFTNSKQLNEWIFNQTWLEHSGVNSVFREQPSCPQSRNEFIVTMIRHKYNCREAVTHPVTHELTLEQNRVSFLWASDSGAVQRAYVVQLNGTRILGRRLGISHLCSENAGS